MVPQDREGAEMIVCVKSVATKVAIGSHVGDFAAGWVGPPDPEPGLCLDVEVSLGQEPLLWRVDIRPAEPGATPGIAERDGAYFLTGLAHGSAEGGGLSVSVAPYCLVLLSVAGDLPPYFDDVMVVARSTTCTLYPTHV